MKKLLTVLILSMALLSGVVQAAEQTTEASPPSLSVAAATQLLHDGKPVYSCPMHAHILSDKEGRCPICGMDLTQITKIEGAVTMPSDDKTMTMPMMESK